MTRPLDTSQLGPIRVTPERDWRLPYRSIDAAGAPDTATAVGWRWIEAEGHRLRLWYGGEVVIESAATDQGTTVIALYHGTNLMACATIFRDPMNFAVLVRWRAPDSEVC